MIYQLEKHICATYILLINIYIIRGKVGKSSISLKAIVLNSGERN